MISVDDIVEAFLGEGLEEGEAISECVVCGEIATTNLLSKAYASVQTGKHYDDGRNSSFIAWKGSGRCVVACRIHDPDLVVTAYRLLDAVGCFAHVSAPT